MQANGESQGAMPSLNEIITSGNQQSPNQVSYSYTRTVQQEGNQPPQSNSNSTYKTSTTTTNVQGGPNSTTTEVRKVVTSQQPSTETSYYSKKVTTKTTTTTTSTRNNQGPSSQTISRYGNTSTSGGSRNQTGAYSRPAPQTSKTTTTTTTIQRGQYGPNSSNTNSQVYRGNQRNAQQPAKMGTSQSYAGNKYQPKRPEVSKSYKPKAKSPEPGTLKRKTINRGNPIENVQITHIIYSSGPAEFNITEELNLDNLNTAPIQISKADRAKLQKSGKVSATCSCDGVEIAQPKKVNLKGSTTHYQHARGIGMTNDKKENINPQFYSSEIKKLEPIYKQKEKEKIENVQSFRSAGKSFNSPSPNKSATKTSTTYNRNQNQTSRGGATSNASRGMASSTINRGGTSSTSTRGGVGNSRGAGSTTTKTTTTVYRGGNMGDGDGEIIKETNTKVQMGSRSYKNTSQPTTTVSHERKVYNQKNFFNK